MLADHTGQESLKCGNSPCVSTEEYPLLPSTRFNNKKNWGANAVHGAEMIRPKVDSPGEVIQLFVNDCPFYLNKQGSLKCGKKLSRMAHCGIIKPAFIKKPYLFEEFRTRRKIWEGLLRKISHGWLPAD